MGTSRARNILEFTLAAMLRRAGRQGALLLVYTTVVFALASALFLTHALRREARALLRGAPEMVVQRMSAGRHDLMPVASVERLRAIRGVREATPRLWGYYFDPVLGANYTVIGLGDEERGVWGDLMGDEIAAPARKTILVGSGVSRARGLYPGDIYPFRTYAGGSLNLRVSATLPASTELVAADLMVMDAADFRALFGMDPAYATDVALSVRNASELVTIAGKIVAEMPDSRPIIRDEVLRTYDAVYTWRGGVMVAILGGAVLAFVILAWDRASGLSAEERREIGILKAVGWETGDILLMKAWEGAAVSLTAYLLGVVLAYAHVFFGGASLFVPVLKGWSTLYPEFHLTPAVDGFQVAALFLFTVVPYTVATIVPSWRAATVDPDEVMRA